MTKTWKVEVRVAITYHVVAADKDSAKASAYDALGKLFQSPGWEEAVILGDDWQSIESITATETR